VEPGPSAPRDPRTASTYILGAISLKKTARAQCDVLPACNAEVMNLYLAEIGD
jgi:hypothetical protein